MANERSEKLSKINFWQRLLDLRDLQRERLKTAIQVVHGDELPLESNRQGLMRWFLHPEITDTMLSTLVFFEQEIPPASRSGLLKFQGGQVIYVIEGRGHTLVNGVKHFWEAGDVINLPLRRDGIIVQHVNDDPEKLARFVAAEPNWFACTTVDRGCGFEQLSDSPDYRDSAR
jgi:hypothetical protein